MISVYSDIEPDIWYDIADTLSGHTRYRIYPISGMSQYRVYPISGPISGYTDIGTKCHDIGSLSFPISHTMSLVPSSPLTQGWGCCHLLVIAMESFIQCNELYSFFSAAAAAPAEPGPAAPAAAAQHLQRRWRGRLLWRVGKCLVVHNVQFCKPLVVLA